MKAFIIGLIMVSVGLYLGYPAEWAFGWFEQVAFVIKGFAPIFLVVLGVITVLLGVADIRDRIDSRKKDD